MSQEFEKDRSKDSVGKHTNEARRTFAFQNSGAHRKGGGRGSDTLQGKKGLEVSKESTR
jgi:hypothetical protein